MCWLERKNGFTKRTRRQITKPKQSSLAKVYFLKAKPEGQYHADYDTTIFVFNSNQNGQDFGFGRMDDVYFIESVKHSITRKAYDMQLQLSRISECSLKQG